MLTDPLVRLPDRLHTMSPERVARLIARWRVLMAFRRAWKGRHPERGNKVEVLRGGDAGLDAMEQAIATARHHVHVEMYMIGDDPVGRRMVGLLAAAARRGVVVRLIYDAVGSIEVPGGFFRRLEAAGGQVHAFHAPGLAYGAWEFIRRNHRKLVIRDGAEAIIGGINWTSDFEPLDEGGTGWRDLAVRVRGPAVAEVQLFFWSSWFYTRGGEPLPDFAEYFPPLRREGRTVVYARSTFRFLRRRSVQEALLSAIERSRRSVRLMQSYFVPNRAMMAALARARRRGVRVELVTPGNSDVPLAQDAGRHCYGRLLRMGVDIFEDQGPMLHTKAVIVDGRRSLIGSSNVNYRSFLLNLELSLEILGTSVARVLGHEFRAVRAESTRVTMATVRGWGWMERMRQRFFYHLRFLI